MNILEKTTRPTQLRIHIKNLNHNFQQVQKQVGNKKILCIVKGNAYGHGIIPIAKACMASGADYLGVAIPEEGILLREAGIMAPILVLSAISNQQVATCIKHKLSITTPSDEKLAFIEKTAEDIGKKAIVHLKIDTGMGRIGVHWERADKFLPVMQQAKNIIFEGIYAHFARSDDDSELTKLQIDRFTKALEVFQNKGYSFKLVHHANSGGILFHSYEQFSMVRAGLVLYGLYDGKQPPKHMDIRPVLSWITQAVFFKYIPAKTGIGYGHEYVSKDETRIITLPVGYADGYQRAMGKGGQVIIKDKLYPIVGRVCMDQMMVDIGKNGEVYPGDEVILVGESNNKKISLQDIAKYSNTSIYELATQISNRVPRIILD